MNASTQASNDRVTLREYLELRLSAQDQKLDEIRQMLRTHCLESSERQDDHSKRIRNIETMQAVASGWRESHIAEHRRYYAVLGTVTTIVSSVVGWLISLFKN